MEGTRAGRAAVDPPMPSASTFMTGAERAVCLASLAVAAFPAPHAGLLARPLGGKPGHQQPILAPPPKPVSPHFSAPPSDAIAVSRPVCTDDAAIGTCAVPRPSAARSAAQFLAGGVAGAVTKTLVAPLERVCCMLMAPAEGAAPGMLAALRTAWLEGGVPALFRGHGATLLKIVPASAVQFAVYHGVKDLLLHRRRDGRARAGPAAAPGAQLTDLERLLAGALAGAAATVATYPLESTRSVMSVAGGVPGGLLEAAVSVLRAQGPAGLYRGFGPTLVSDAFGSAVGFTLYEAYTRAYERATGKKAGPALRAVMGAASAATVMTFTMPLEVVRRRLQVQGVPGRPVLYRGALHCAQCIARDQGLAAFYVAAVPGYLKAAPSVGGMYYLYELFTRRLEEAPVSEST